ncbi:MAG: DNRLRE domain-containing protein, partial [Nitrososphaerales archaeon]
MRKNSIDTNEGASDMLRIQKTGKNRIIVSFDQDAIISAVGDRTLESAKLRLHIIDTGINWGLGGEIEAHRLFVDWAEGNGWNAGLYDPFRGTTPGSTWNCAVDTKIWSYYAECSYLWDGGTYGDPADSVIITNNLSGVIEFDVTGDVKDFLSNGTNFGWLIKKTDESQSGTVIFASKENGVVSRPELVLLAATVENEPLISDFAIDPAANDTAVVIEADSSTSNDPVEETIETNSPTDSPTSLPPTETSDVIEQMTNSTIMESSLSGQANSTVATAEPSIVPSNSKATIEPISLLEPVTLAESASNSTAVAEASVSQSNSTLSDAVTVEPFSNSTITAPEYSVQPLNSTAIMEPIVLPESTNSTMEVSSNSTMSSDPPEQTEVKSLLVPAADLVITQDKDFDWVIAGEMYVYTIIIKNSGPSEATNVVITDILPAGTRFTTFSASQGTCSETDNIVTCSLGAIPADDYATIAVVVTVKSDVQASSLTNYASVTSDTADLDKDNNSATGMINVTRQSDLSITIAGSSEPVAVGQELTYNITVTNDGPSDAANVVATDALPKGATLLTTISSQGTCALTGSVVTCNLSTIPDNGSATITIVATVNPSNLTDSITTSASVTSDTDRYAGPDTYGETARYRGPDSDNNSRKIVVVEMTETEAGLSASKHVGDIAANQTAEFLLSNNALPDAQLNAIEITPASNLTDVNLNITVSNNVPANIPLLDTVDPLLFMQVSLNGSDVDFGDANTYSEPPEITFTVDKNDDGTCQEVELFMFDEEKQEWTPQSLSISQVDDMGSYCVYEGTVPHFSTFMIGLKKPTG